MKTISVMFPNEANIKGILTKAGLKIPEDFRFSDINIVIGKNGSGKTRFLNILKALYESDKNNGEAELLYGYFPGLSDRLVQKGTELPEHELRDFPDQPQVRFDDFFKEIEAQGKDFLVRLAEYRSRSQKKKNEKILEDINSFFHPITGKKLIVPSEGSPQIVTEYAAESGGKETSQDLVTAMECFSPGERLLLYMAVFFALRRRGTQKQIIILDEPETHLHPHALLGFVRALKEHFTSTTVWIATHSLFLLPEFRFENIVYMKDGEIVPRDSSLYETVFAALLGQNNEETRQFFSSLPHWQYSEFITECFASPKYLTTVNPKDEQVRLFIKALQERKIHRVLDCGGGSGRLGLSLEAANASPELYAIYDAHPSYSGDKFSVYTRLEDITDSYDCVVMMNFLHEVEPDEWPDLFCKIYDLLEPDGYLLFVEVAALANGEWPNETGYMLLGKSELLELFDIIDNLPEIHIRNNQKSMGILVPRRFVKNVTAATVYAAIDHLEKRTYDELRQIRLEASNWKKDKSGNPFNARRYAFMSQQYINAKLFKTGHPLPSFSWHNMTAPSGQELSQIFKLACEILREDPAVNPVLSGSIRSSFRSAMKYYINNGEITDTQHEQCFEALRSMEEQGAMTRTLEAFSTFLSMLQFRMEEY